MERSDASKEYSSGSVRVQYFGDEETFEYSIDDFLANGDLAPYHVIDMTEKSATSVSQEQSTFKMQERGVGDILPLQRRHIAKPEQWIKNNRAFDLTWEGTFDSSGDGTHFIPKYKVKNCKLDCCR